MKKVDLLKLFPSCELNDDSDSTGAYDMLNRFCHGYLSKMPENKSLRFFSDRFIRGVFPDYLVIHRISDVQYVLSQYANSYPRQYLVMRVGITVLNDQHKVYPSYMESKHQHHPTLITWEDGNLLVAFTDWLRMQNCYQYSMYVHVENTGKIFNPVIL